VQLTQIKAWSIPTTLGVHYEKLLGAIGSEDFGVHLREAIMSSTAGARRIYLFEATGRENHELQYSFCEPGVAELFETYNKWYQPLDPVCDAYQAAPRTSNVAFLRVRPSDIASTGFRRQFYDEPGILERISIIQRGIDSWRVLSVARHLSDGYFSDGEVEMIVGLACLSLPMLPMNRDRPAAKRCLSVLQLEERFAGRFAELTERERQVCARAAIGMTVEGTALDLGIAKTSVRTYRKRAYQRLRVTSPFELCTLVTH